MVSRDFESISRAAQFIPATVSAAGMTQNDATPLSAVFTVVSSAAVGSGVNVAPLIGQLQLIYNGALNTINVWPTQGMTLAPNSQNAAAVLGAGRCFGIVVTSTTQGFIAFNSSSFG